MIDAERIPAELRARPQWVVWRLETRDGEPTKVPYRATGFGKASSTDATTWTTFEVAVGVSYRYDGIGYVFAASDPFCGVDLDRCLVGEILDPRARVIVEKVLRSFCEISPSGTGVKLIVRGAKNGNTRCKAIAPWGGFIEIYDRDRFWTITGRPFPGSPATIEERQTQLNGLMRGVFPASPPIFVPQSVQPIGLDDQELLERAIVAKNGSEFEALWNGRWEDRYGSQSEADLALVGKLAFWTGRDADRIDRLFRGSGLMREKWLRDDYRERTIQAAITATTDVYKQPRPASDAPRTQDASDLAPSDDGAFRLEPVDWQALAAAGPQELEYLLPPFLPRRKRIWAVGPGESGKSIWAAAESAALSRAGELVVYISQENGLEEEARRFLRLRPDFAHMRLYVDQGLDLVIAEHRTALFAVTEGAALVVLDTLTACWSGDEDSNAALTDFDRDVLKPLQIAGASTLVLDHTGNPQPNVRRRGVSAPRGASAKGQKTDFLLEFRANGDGTFQVERGKKRGTHGRQPRSYQVVDTPDGTLELVVTEAEERDLVGEIAELLEDGDWVTANKLRQPKSRGGIGADLNAVKDALTDDRFESAAGPTIGKRKGSTYYRLKEAL